MQCCALLQGADQSWFYLGYSSLPSILTSLAVERAQYPGGVQFPGARAFALKRKTATCVLAGSINANQKSHSPPNARFSDAKLRLAPAICDWMHSCCRCVAACGKCSRMGDQGMFPRGADLPIVSKGAGVKVRHVSNSSSRQLARFGPVAAWSICMLFLHVSSKASE